MSAYEALDEAFDGVSKWESVDIERAKITADFLRDLVSEDKKVGECSVEDLITYLEEEHSL